MLWYPQADLINQLYQGKLKDYVRCLECGYESWRIDTYLDIPLVIRPFGASQAYGSVVCDSLHTMCYHDFPAVLSLFRICSNSASNFSTLAVFSSRYECSSINTDGAETMFLLQEEALQAFIQPETLDGPNQYFCERCQKKCDARKVRGL